MASSADKSNTALKYLGVPYVHQGRSAGGLDCVGLIVRVGRDLGFKIDDQYAYQKIPDPSVLMGGMNDNFTRRPDLNYQPGDILVFRIRRDPQHMGLLLDNGELIHAYENAGKVIKHTLDQRWRKRIIAVYTYE